MKHSLSLALSLTAGVIGLANQTALATSYTNTIAQMTAYITSQMAINNIPGLSIALVDDQTVVWATGFGYADREAGVAADADTVFHVGSCSKAILGTAYMQLWEQGRVDLEAPLTNYMAEFSMLPRFTNSTVTIRSLLNHHSGLPGDFFNGMGTTTPYYNLPAWLINCLQGDYPFAPVNERNYYCNSGFVLLSDVVRRITGTNFPEATDAMLFSPLGMEASSFLPDKAAISNRLAAAYDTNGERHPTEFMNALGSGSMYSSANDLTRYIRMIIANGRFNGQTLVSSNAIDLMTEAQGTNLPLNVSGSYPGLGWDDVNDYRLRYAGKVSWKDGATYMHSAFMAVSRDLKLGVAVIQNTAGSQCDAIGFQALQLAVLDKTSVHWPTNTFVPTPSPVTNRPQAELDALAGLYAGDSGYHKVVAETGSITFIKDAYSDAATSYSNLAPRANGWFSLTNSQEVQFAFTNLSGHDMVVVHEVSGAFEIVASMGERYLPLPLSAAWNSRTNRVYRMMDMYPDDYFWGTGNPQTKTLRFRTKDGALLTSWMFGMFVIQPTNDNLAFQRGVQYRKGGAVQATTTNGFELLNYSSYRFIDEAAIPTMAMNSATNGTIPFANGTQWYFFSGQTGKTYRAQMSAPGQEVFVRITDREGITLASGTNGPTTWACTSNGTYAIAVSATNVFSYSLSLSMSGQALMQCDFDGDRKADPTIYDEQTGVWKVKLSSANYYLITTTLNGLGGPGYASVSADYDGDRLADPAVYQEATPSTGSGQAGQWIVLPSTANYAVPVVLAQALGGPGYDGVPADYDGDGKADPAVYQNDQGNWNVRFSSANYYLVEMPGLLGAERYVAVPADYDGDGKADPAIYDETNGYWIIKLSSSGYLAIALTQTLGGSDYMPCPGDFDGDRLADPAVKNIFSNEWIVMFSSGNYTPVHLTLVFE